MKSSIFIPKTINVGYQNRSGTYTGKLAYVIYYDEKGKLRKEASWNSWRDKEIPNEEFENVPTSGFVLNKKVGDYDSGWNHRHAYCRIYDPRNFEFEITIENLLYILENANSIKGKGLEGEFVYGWDGKDLVLMPVESPDYKAIMNYSNIVNNNEYVKAKDLKIGATYLNKNNNQFIYMGRYDRWAYCYKKAGKIFESEYTMKKYCIKNDIEPDEIKIEKTYWSGRREVKVWKPEEEGYMPYEKCHVFYYQSKNYQGEIEDNFVWHKSISNKFISCVDENCSQDYADLFNKLEATTNYSPIDSSKEEHFDYTFDEFREYINKVLPIGSTWAEKTVFVHEDYNAVRLKRKNSGFIIYDNDKAVKYGFALDENRYRYSSSKDMIEVTLEEIYEALKPYYKKIYLRNGRLYRTEGM